MSFFKSILLFILYYALFLFLVVLMKVLVGIEYIDGIGYYWIPTAISLIIFSLIHLGTLGKDENRPRASLGLGFTWLVLTALFDYVFLVDQFKFLSEIIPVMDGFVGDLTLIFDLLPFDAFYQTNLTNLIIRYVMIFAMPFVLSLFIPRSEVEFNLPEKK